jgi:hypothetical protein
VILGLVALVSFVLCLLALVVVVLQGGPVIWISTAVLAIWAGRRAWRWLSEPVPVSVQAVLPPDNPTWRS